VQRAIEAFAPLISRPFDAASTTTDSTLCFAHTFLWKVKQGPTTSLVQRDWFVVAALQPLEVADVDAVNRDLVLASYRGGDRDPGSAAVDIFDCEEMVQSIRFDA
jgi:hypothetical protein